MIRRLEDKIRPELSDIVELEGWPEGTGKVENDKTGTEISRHLLMSSLLASALLTALLVTLLSALLATLLPVSLAVSQNFPPFLNN